MTGTPPPNGMLQQRQLLLEQVEGRLREQIDEFDGLDRKATTALGASVVLLGLVINNTDHFATSHDPVPAVFYSALAVLAVALIAGVVALRPRKVRAVPEPGPLLVQHATKRIEETVGELATTKAHTFGLNVPIIQTKVARLNFQLALLALGGGLLVCAYVLARWT